MLAWDSGERIGALLQAEWSHLSGEWLTLPAEIRKGGRQDRAYKLAADTLAILGSIRRPQRKLILPWPFHHTTLYNHYRRIRRRAGLPYDRRSGFHRIRRTVATFFEAAGGNATELLGHSDRRVTRGYLDPRLLKQPQAIDLLFRPDNPMRQA